METNFNFKSQPYTTIEQSQRLIELGLKAETADCCHWYCISCVDEPFEREKIPAWSLHRLLSLIPKEIEVKNPYRKWICFNMNFDYNIIYFQSNMEDFIGFYEGNVYDKAISCIEWLIKEGYFNKEYLDGND